MAKPKITLTMGDGTEVRTLEELREHADIYTLEQCYFNGSLLRWLKAWGHPWERIMGDIERYDGDCTLHETLCDAFQIPWNEELEIAYTEMKAVVEQAKGTECQTDKEPLEEEAAIIEERINEDVVDSLAVDIMDDALFSWDNVYHKPRFVETKDYIFCERSWKECYRKDKKTGVSEPIETAQFLIHVSKCGNKLYSLDDRTLMSIDLETKNEKQILERACRMENSVQHFSLAPVATETMVAYRQPHRLSLFDINAKKEIEIADDVDLDVIYSNPVSPGLAEGSMSLTDDTLYFLTGTCHGTLDDGRSPLWALCKYDIDSKKTSVLMTREELEKAFGDTEKPTSLLLDEQTMIITNIPGFNFGKRYGTPYWAKLALNGDRAEVKDIFWIENGEVLGGTAYEDGMLYITQRGNSHFYLSFVGLNGEEQSWLLWGPDVSAERCVNPPTPGYYALGKLTVKEFKMGLKSAFRLGDWFYYPLAFEGNKDRKIWKVSLKDGERIDITPALSKEDTIMDTTPKNEEKITTISQALQTFAQTFGGQFEESIESSHKNQEETVEERM